ncbi:peptidase M72 family protein, partial [Pseudomonas sp. SIMBA_059]
PVSTTVSTAAQLFSLQPTQDRATLQQTAQGYLATLLADPANAEVTFIKMDPAVVSKQMQVLAVTLPDGKTAQFHLREYN